MNGPHRVTAIKQVESIKLSFLKRISKGHRATKCFFDQYAVVPTGETPFGGLRINRDDTISFLIATALSFGTDQHIDNRVRHLALASEAINRPIKECFRSETKLLCSPGLVKKDHPKDTRGISDFYLDERTTLLGPARADSLHGGEHHNFFTGKRIGNVGLARSVDVTPGIVPEKIEN